MAVDSGGNALSYSNGSWSRQQSIDSSGPYALAVSCATPSFCVAVDDVGNAITFSKGTWAAPVALDDVSVGLTDVSCPAPGACVALSGDGHAFTYSGGAWSASVATGSSYGGSLWCAGIASCMLVTSDGGVFVDRGGRWTTAPPIALRTGYEIPAVSCTSSTHCVAIDSSFGGSLAPGTPPGGSDLYVYDGHAWSGPQQTAPVELSHLSCPTTTFCVAGDRADNVYTYDGVTWSSATHLDNQMTHNLGGGTISCASPAFCAAATEQGDIVTFNGTSWSAPVLADPAPGFFTLPAIPVVVVGAGVVAVVVMGLAGLYAMKRRRA